MSRRRAPRVPTEWMVRVVCTGRLSHDSTELGLLSWWPGGVHPDWDEHIDAHLSERGGRGIAPDAAGRPQKTYRPSNMRRLDGQRWLEYRCPRCGRNVPLKWTTASERAAKAYADGEPFLDISAQ